MSSFKDLINSRFSSDKETKKALTCILDNIKFIEPGNDVLRLKEKGIIDFTLAGSIKEFEIDEFK